MIVLYEGSSRENAWRYLMSVLGSGKYTGLKMSGFGRRWRVTAHSQKKNVAMGYRGSKGSRSSTTKNPRYRFRSGEEPRAGYQKRGSRKIRRAHKREGSAQARYYLEQSARRAAERRQEQRRHNALIPAKLKRTRNGGYKIYVTRTAMQRLNPWRVWDRELRKYVSGMGGGAGYDVPETSLAEVKRTISVMNIRAKWRRYELREV